MSHQEAQKLGSDCPAVWNPGKIIPLLAYSLLPFFILYLPPCFLPRSCGLVPTEACCKILIDTSVWKAPLPVCSERRNVEQLAIAAFPTCIQWWHHHHHQATQVGSWLLFSGEGWKQVESRQWGKMGGKKVKGQKEKEEGRKGGPRQGGKKRYSKRLNYLEKSRKSKGKQ